MVIVGANTPNTPNLLNGTGDADTITAGTNADTIDGLGGFDTITGGQLTHGGDGDDTVEGGRGVFFGDAGNDRLIENGGETSYVFLDGGPGNDTIGSANPSDPFQANSIATYVDATGGVHVDLRIDSIPQDVGGGAGTDTLILVTGVVGGSGNDVLIGSEPTARLAGSDLLIGGSGDDSIDGGGGNDTLVDGPGNDTIDGGAGGADLLLFGFKVAGADALNIATPTSGVTVDLSNSGPQDIGGGMGIDVIRNIEKLSGSTFSDSLTGSAGNDYIDGGGGNGFDTINGGAGNDELHASAGGAQIFGGTGDDRIYGSGGVFNYLQGNQGNDTVTGGFGNDWVVGGQDQDTLFGNAGEDIVYGNRGADLCDGGDGDDIVRGGQDDDTVVGGAGNDFVAGDRGSDTLTGGSGADRFYSFADAGIDRVTDFNRAEGDRVEIQTGDTWTVAQVGADTVVTVGGAAQLILVGVTMSSLTGDWIYSGTT